MKKLEFYANVYTLAEKRLYANNKVKTANRIVIGDLFKNKEDLPQHELQPNRYKYIGVTKIEIELL